MTGSPSLGSFACDAGTLQELMAGKTLACPCCDGPLTAEKLARLLSDVQRLAATASDQPRPPAPSPAPDPIEDAARRAPILDL